MSTAEKTLLERLSDILHRMEDEFRALVGVTPRTSESKDQDSAARESNGAQPPPARTDEDS